MAGILIGLAWEVVGVGVGVIYLFIYLYSHIVLLVYHQLVVDQ